MNNFWEISTNIQIVGVLIAIAILLTYIAFKLSEDKDKPKHARH